jgi:hypothetical protein
MSTMHVFFGGGERIARTNDDGSASACGYASPRAACLTVGCASRPITRQAFGRTVCLTSFHDCNGTIEGFHQGAVKKPSDWHRGVD